MNGLEDVHMTSWVWTWRCTHGIVGLVIDFGTYKKKGSIWWFTRTHIKNKQDEEVCMSYKKTKPRLVCGLGSHKWGCGWHSPLSCYLFIFPSQPLILKTSRIFNFLLFWIWTPLLFQCFSIFAPLFSLFSSLAYYFIHFVSFLSLV